MSETPPTPTPPVKVIEWTGDALRGRLRLLDQTQLPEHKVFIEIADAEQLWQAVRRLSVRGAPAIGVAAGYGMVVAAQWIPDGADFMSGLAAAAEYLNGSRPTAVNLAWATGRVLRRAQRTVPADFDDVRRAMLDEAVAIHREDEQLCLAIGRNAEPIIAAHAAVMTQCNAGALATAGIGTATAGMYLAHADGHAFTVYCPETRPLLQGSRLTAWELRAAGIDVVLITDNMAAQVMKERRVGMVITGADRIAANGDAANKIGTYSLAVNAARHGIPFYVAAPYSTFDLSIATGDDIPIEQRGSDEITNGFGRRTAPEKIKTYSPAFDVTPADLITAIVTDRGLIQPVNETNVRQMMGGG
jgi:methylthioribose-1-phosphate isomerase